MEVIIRFKILASHCQFPFGYKAFMWGLKTILISVCSSHFKTTPNNVWVTVTRCLRFHVPIQMGLTSPCLFQRSVCFRDVAVTEGEGHPLCLRASCIV